MLLAACNPLPDVAFETERLQVAPDFDFPICQGTRDRLDEMVERVEDAAGRLTTGAPYLVYWLRGGIGDWCSDGENGCYFPGTRVIVAKGRSVPHEIVHAVIDSEGEAFFFEEGAAEVLAGVGAYSAADEPDESPRDDFRISRDAYQAGRLNYREATHFMHYVRAEKGEGGLGRVASTLRTDASPSAIEGVLEDLFDLPLERIELDYLNRAANYYPGIEEGLTETIEPEAAIGGVRRTLDCGAADTLGPLWDDAPGMYRVATMRIAYDGFHVLSSLGDLGTWVSIFNPRSGVTRRRATDWRLPNPEKDAGEIRVEPGDLKTEYLERGSYLVLFASDNPDEIVDAALRVEALRSDDEPPRRSDEPHNP